MFLLRIPSLILVLLVVVVTVAVLLQETVQHALAAVLVNDEVVTLLVILKRGLIVGQRNYDIGRPPVAANSSTKSPRRFLPMVRES
jgi:hypothetical protein